MLPANQGLPKPPQPGGANKNAEGKIETEQPPKVIISFAGKRDPFISPIVRSSSSASTAACGTGKRCLVVDQVVLKGTVKAPSGMIAVVENAARRAYFLRENDPVFNGVVVKITLDFIVFRETLTDKLGKQSIREVIKKVNASAV